MLLSGLLVIQQEQGMTAFSIICLNLLFILKSLSMPFRIMYSALGISLVIDQVCVMVFQKCGSLTISTVIAYPLWFVLALNGIIVC